MDAPQVLLTLDQTFEMYGLKVDFDTYHDSAAARHFRELSRSAREPGDKCESYSHCRLSPDEAAAWFETSGRAAVHATVEISRLATANNLRDLQLKAEHLAELSAALLAAVRNPEYQPPAEEQMVYSGIVRAKRGSA